MSKRGGSNVVFVGNIPYDISEEQLVKVFSEVGRVVDFRLVSDREQGKFKGYGFCEYEDAETAASAVRNLNDVEVGGRPLRLDYADADPMQDNGRGRTPNVQPTLPEGVPIPLGVSATDVITQTIASLPPNQLMDILTQMKALTTHAPEQARREPGPRSVLDCEELVATQLNHDRVGRHVRECIQQGQPEPAIRYAGLRGTHFAQDSPE